MPRVDPNHDVARELEIARTVAGLTQRELATRLGMSQSRVSRILAGDVALTIGDASDVALACGHRLTLRVVPSDGVRLRDSGQLGLAQVVRSQAHASWRVALEVPTGSSPDRRAADVVLINPLEAIMLELERWLRDLQAQLRAAQLKRAALSERMGRPVRLVIGVPDTRATRQAVEPFSGLLASALPVRSRRAWACIRSGEPIGGDALLWIRGEPAPTNGA
jgi:transcriptional regulator with XRE-family HTH domain